jgi:hypothetical protein
LLGGLLGGEEEAAEVEAGEGRVSAEAFAASLAADFSTASAKAPTTPTR